MAKSQYIMARILEAKEKSELLSLSCKSKRHVEKFKTRHGRIVYYYREGKGPRIRLPDPNVVGQAHFNRAYALAARGEALAVQKPDDLPSYSFEKGTVGYVYFARSLDLVKIGFSKSVPKRVRSIATACPTEIEVIKIIPGTNQTERYFHTHFAGYRQKGEWFRLEGALAAFLSVRV
nr:GIY-YIG nuclease family protein [Brucella anthropi]